MIVGQIGAGHSIDEILTDYLWLEREETLQALRYDAWFAEEREVVLTGSRQEMHVNHDAGDTECKTGSY
jgi:hypothetical protein